MLKSRRVELLALGIAGLATLTHFYSPKKKALPSTELSAALRAPETEKNSLAFAFQKIADKSADKTPSNPQRSPASLTPPLTSPPTAADDFESNAIKELNGLDFASATERAVDMISDVKPDDSTFLISLFVFIRNHGSNDSDLAKDMLERALSKAGQLSAVNADFRRSYAAQLRAAYNQLARDPDAGASWDQAAQTMENPEWREAFAQFSSGPPDNEP